MTSRIGTWKIAAGIGMLALIGAGCGSSGTSSSSGAPTTAAPTTVAKANTTKPPTQAVVSGTGVRVIPGSADGTSPCEEAAPTPASPGQVGAGQGGSAAVKTAAQAEAEAHGARGKVQPVPLTPSEQSILQAQMAVAKQVAVAYPTVKDAEAAGYSKSTVYVPCIGAHYTNVGLAAKFDPAHPSELLYTGTDPDSKLVGLSYLVWHGGGPPPGFAGANDRWHQHNANGGLCLKGGLVVGGESSTRQECAAMGGRKTLLTDIWMVHAWVVPGITCKWGTFSGECPELGGRLGGTATDGPYPSKFS
ncbi:MAG: hypothetical protein QOE62_2953 [Actinomycetota bacterium]|jgi:hypothetical protein|nr:hypothetical protein [Actinomycetota bacterium]